MDHLGISNACNTERCRAVNIIGLIVMVRTRLERWDALGEFFWWGESESLADWINLRVSYLGLFLY